MEGRGKKRDVGVRRRVSDNPQDGSHPGLARAPRPGLRGLRPPALPATLASRAVRRTPASRFFPRPGMLAAYFLKNLPRKFGSLPSVAGGGALLRPLACRIVPMRTSRAASMLFGSSLATFMKCFSALSCSPCLFKKWARTKWPCTWSGLILKVVRRRLRISSSVSSSSTPSRENRIHAFIAG